MTGRDVRADGQVREGGVRMLRKTTWDHTFRILDAATKVPLLPCFFAYSYILKPSTDRAWSLTASSDTMRSYGVLVNEQTSKGT